MSHHSDRVGDMNDENNQANTSRFFSGKENEELADRLLALHTTIKTTPAAPEHDVLAIDSSRALFMRDAWVIKEELALAHTRFDASFRERRPGIDVPDFCTDTVDGKTGRLARDANGRVYGPQYNPLIWAVFTRMAIFLNLWLAVLLWKVVRFVSSWAGAYQVHVNWTLIGLFLGTNKWALGEIMAAFRVFKAAPFDTLKSIYDREKDFLTRLEQETQLLQHLPVAQIGRAMCSTFLIGIWTMIIVEAVSFYIGGIEFDDKCVYYTWCFEILSEFARRLGESPLPLPVN